LNGRVKRPDPARTPGPPHRGNGDPMPAPRAILCANIGIPAPPYAEEGDYFGVFAGLGDPLFVMPGHSRPKDGVLSHAYVPGIHVLTALPNQRRGWPDQARP